MVLGIAVGTVKSLAREALGRLRLLVPDLELDDDPVTTGAAGAPPPR